MFYGMYADDTLKLIAYTKKQSTNTNTLVFISEMQKL